MAAVGEGHNRNKFCYSLRRMREIRTYGRKETLQKEDRRKKGGNIYVAKKAVALSGGVNLN